MKAASETFAPERLCFRPCSVRGTGCAIPLRHPHEPLIRRGFPHCVLHQHAQGEIHPLEVKAGDKILFGKWSGTEVKLDGEDLLIMKESDILGIVG